MTQKRKQKQAPNTDIKIVSATDLNLNEESKVEIAPEAYAQYVRALRQNWRQGTVACKDRSEVAFSNKKPWKQKGTGRARAGSPRSPLWRKGGVIFGPQERVRTLKIPKNLKTTVLSSLLWKYLDDKNVVCLNWAAKEQPKTSHAFKALTEAGLHNKKVILFANKDDYLTISSFANIPNVSILLFDQPNAYDLSDGNCWVFLNKDLEIFKGMVNSWT